MTSVSGIKTPDSNTIVFTLTQPATRLQQHPGAAVRFGGTG